MSTESTDEKKDVRQPAFRSGEVVTDGKDHYVVNCDMLTGYTRVRKIGSNEARSLPTRHLRPSRKRFPT